MRDREFQNWLASEVEAEAELLKKQTGLNEDSPSVRMPEDSFEDLLKRRAAMEGKKPAEAPGVKPFRIRKRVLAAVALVAVLITAVGIGASGSRLFAPEVESAMEDGEYNVQISTGDDVIYIEATEEEAYEEIEERLGILALRLGNKPVKMKLEKAFIDEVMGEAQMEFCIGNKVLTVYENKQSDSAAFGMTFDGEIVDVVELFYLYRTIDVVKIKMDATQELWMVQIEEANACYYIISNMVLEEFKEIISGLIFESV